MRSFVAALLLETIGGAVAVLAAVRSWQSVLTPRPRPFADDVLAVAGRDVDAAPLALGLVALAGVVAILATRGRARQLIGLVLAAAGIGLVWRSAAGFAAIGAARARELVAAHHPGVDADVRVAPMITVHAGWPTVSVLAGVLVVTGGVLVVWRGAGWRAMSARYERPLPASTRSLGAAGAERVPAGPGSADAAGESVAADAQQHARAAAMRATSYWNALDRGEDPTAPHPPGPRE